MIYVRHYYLQYIDCAVKPGDMVSFQLCFATDAAPSENDGGWRRSSHRSRCNEEQK